MVTDRSEHSDCQFSQQNVKELNHHKSINRICDKIKMAAASTVQKSETIPLPRKTIQ